MYDDFNTYITVNRPCKCHIIIFRQATGQKLCHNEIVHFGCVTLGRKFNLTEGDQTTEAIMLEDQEARSGRSFDRKLEIASLFRQCPVKNVRRVSDMRT